MGLPFRFVSFQPDCQFAARANAPQLPAQGPGRSRWRPESFPARPGRSLRVGRGTTKKPRVLSGAGFVVSGSSTSLDHRPRARPFDGSIPCGLARLQRIRTREQRPSRPVEDLSYRSPCILDAGSGHHGRSLSFLGPLTRTTVAAERFGVKRKKISGDEQHPSTARCPGPARGEGRCSTPPRRGGARRRARRHAQEVAGRRRRPSCRTQPIR